MSLVCAVEFEGSARRPGVPPSAVRADHLHALWTALSGRERTEDEADDHRAPLKPFALRYPFAAAPLLIDSAGRVRFTAVAMGEEGCEAVARAVERWKGRRHALGPQAVQGEGARLAVPPTLAADYVRREGPPPTRLGWRLVSPAAVRQGEGVELPFPEPSAVFRGLEARAAAFLGLPSPPQDEGGRAKTRYPRVSRYALETRLVELGRRRFIGAVGVVWYDLGHLGPELRHHHARLWSLAALVGIGHSTPYGMGAVECLREPAPRPGRAGGGGAGEGAER